MTGYGHHGGEKNNSILKVLVGINVKAKFTPGNVGHAAPTGRTMVKEKCGTSMIKYFSGIEYLVH